MASNSESREPDDLRARNRTILLVIVVVAILGTIGLGLLAAWGAFTLSPDDQPPPSPTVAGMPGGETFAYLVEVGSDSVTIDPARMLTGEQARAAAAEDGVIGPNEDLPNDFYIVNPDPGPTSVDVDPEATVTVLAFDSAGSHLAGRDLELGFRRHHVHGADRVPSGERFPALGFLKVLIETGEQALERSRLHDVVACEVERYLVRELGE